MSTTSMWFTCAVDFMPIQHPRGTWKRVTGGDGHSWGGLVPKEGNLRSTTTNSKPVFPPTHGNPLYLIMAWSQVFSNCVHFPLHTGKKQV